MRNAVLLVALFALLSMSAEAVQYQVHDLGMLPGDARGIATRINNAGQVIGDSWSADWEDSIGCFMWSNSTGMIDIQVPGQLSRPGGINDQGQICGVGLSMAGAFATVRQPNGDIIQLPQPAGDIGACAYDINNSGQVVGWLDDNTDINDERFYAVLWQTNGEIVTMGEGEMWCHANDINNLGKAVWTTEVPDPLHTQQAYRWDSENGSVPLALLDGTSWNAVGAINDSGLMVGRSGYHAVLWTSPDSVIDLGGTGDSFGGACGINNHGQIVGVLGGRAVLWNADGSLAADLSSFLTGTGYSAAYAINDNGWIVGVQGDAYSNSHAILWEPVPEPSSILTLVNGMACLAVVLKRRDLAESVNPPAS